ncbi:MAG: GNAT family N-acetyltransferase [Pikeienuella sp.]
MGTQDSNEQIYPRELMGDFVNPSPPALVPARAILKGCFVDLEPQNAANHAAELYAAGHDSEQGLRIWDYLAYGPWPNEENYAATLRAQSGSLDTIFYSIRDHATGKASGQASYLDIHAVNGVIEIGHIWFGPSLQRVRGATEALFLMLKYAMDDLGYRRMQWRCNGQNARSRQAARRLGFRFEGTFHNHMIFKGKNRDTTWYSILDDEWAEVRGIIENWLSDDNFDANGVAKTSLYDAMQARQPSKRRIGHGKD